MKIIFRVLLIVGTLMLLWQPVAKMTRVGKTTDSYLEEARYKKTKASSRGRSVETTNKNITNTTQVIQQEFVNTLDLELSSGLDVLLEIEDTTDKFFAFNEFLERIEKIDKERSVKIYNAVKDGRGFEPDFLFVLRIALMRNIAAEDVNLVQKLLANGEAENDGIARVILPEIIRGMVNDDPSGAITYVGAMDYSMDQGIAYGALMEAWAKNDFKSALKFSLEQTEPELRELCLNKVVKQSVEKNITSAISRFENMETMQEKSIWAKAIAENLAENDPRLALKFADDLDGDDKKYAISYATNIMASFRPASFSDYLLEPGNDEIKSDFRRVFSNVWSEQSPLEAARWFESNGVGPDNGKDLALNLIDSASIGSSIAMNMIKSNPIEGIAWVSNLYPGESRDYIIKNVVTNSTISNPEHLRSLAEEIRDERLRSKALESISGKKNTDW